MKSKKTLMLALASMMVATNAMANVDNKSCQDESSCKAQKDVVLNKFKDNWFIGVDGGIQNYYGNYSSTVPFGKRIAPVFNFYVGKWFSPAIGVRANFSWSKPISADKDATNKSAYESYEDVFKTKANTLVFNVETMFNVSNMIWGYNENRAYDLIPYVGMGWIRNCDYSMDKTTAVVGLLNSFKLSNRFRLNVDAKVNVFGEGMDGVRVRQGKGMDATTSITAGISYNFGKTNFDRVKYSSCEIEKIQNDLRELNAEKERLERSLAEAQRAVPAVKEVVNTEYVASDVAVFFAINKADLTDKERVNLGMVADMIKKNAGKTFVITGYADKATGSAKFNERLSEDRAKSVYNLLVNEFGVDASQLEVAHMGGVDNMFYGKKELSRIAIIKLK